MKKNKKSKPTKKEKIFFIITLISVIVAVGAIVHAQTGQSHPAIEITYSDIPCSNICNDDDKDGDTSSTNELQSLSSVLSKGNSAGSYSINMNNKNINNVDNLYFYDADGNGYKWKIYERDSGYANAGNLNLEYANAGGCTIDKSDGKMKCTGGFDADGKGITNPGKLLQNMDCVYVKTDNGGSSTDHIAECPSGYYIQWAGCRAGKSIDLSTCDAVYTSDGRCYKWRCYTGETNNFIEIQMQCCR